MLAPPIQWLRTNEEKKSSPLEERDMKKMIGALVIAGSMVFLSNGAALRAEQEPPVPPLVREPAPLPRESPRTLTRGQVLMPNDPLLVKMGEHQERSQSAYKAMTFEQKAVVERYKPRKQLQQADQVTSRREIVVRYAPADNGEFQVTLVSDTNQNASKKSSKKKKGKEGKESDSLAKQLISPLLFPMTTENVQHCKFTVLLALPDMVLLGFEPEPMTTDPIFSGQVFANPETGEIYRLKIDAIHNFEKINKKFKYLKTLSVAVDYPSRPDGYRFPSYMQGNGYAKVWIVKGNFRFDITESGYITASETARPVGGKPTLIPIPSLSAWTRW